jgi:hypothetical protein
MWYRISFELDSRSLRSICHHGQYITLVKHTGSTAPVAGEVTWVSFAPLQRNSVMWEDRCTIYASKTPLSAAAVIQALVTVPARTGQIYLLMGDAFHESGEGLPGRYCVANAENEPIAFGLAQRASVNTIACDAPTNIVPLLAGGTATFSPSEEVSVFLAPFRTSGVLLREVPEQALRLQLSPASPEAFISFDLETNTFRHVSS